VRALAFLCVLAPLAALADEQPDLAERQAELLRAEIANQIQLQAAELLDELVLGWTKEPPFETASPTVLAGLSVPVSLGTGLEAYLENHFAGLVVKNPGARVQLVHCPACSAWVVHSGAKGTVVSRGFDDPEALAQAGVTSGAKHAVFLDFETEGASLVLRARITTLDASLKIVAAKTLTTSTAVPALLRDNERLKSVAETRKEYLEVLGGRGLLVFPVRVAVRTFAPGFNSTAISTPFLWVMGGAEAAFSQGRAWTASLNLGFTWLPSAHVGVMAQGRVSRLLTGSSTSLTWPDLYLFVGGGVFFVQGRSALIFRESTPTIDEILNINQNNEPRTTLGMFTTGLELRVKNRIGIGAYLETYPSVTNTDNIGTYLQLIFNFQSFGVEVSFCF